MSCLPRLARNTPTIWSGPRSNSVLQAEYARLAGIAAAALTAAMQPYLPIVRVFLLLGGAAPDMRERLIQRVEAALRSED
jgi:hypothetical protein